MKSTRQRGFTLLEALVATAVMGASVAALLGLLSGSLRNAARLEGPEQALLLGQSKMNELITAGTESQETEVQSAPAAGVKQTRELAFDQTIEGTWDERFRWEARITRYRSSPQRTPRELLLARVALDVFWKPQGGGGERKLSFETYQLRREPTRE
jgi:prepilin-type N-terminal cleavage/methylation domain-containing protein